MNTTENYTGTNISQILTERQAVPWLGATHLCVSLLVMVANGLVIFVNLKSRDRRIPTLDILTGMAFVHFTSGLLMCLTDVPYAFTTEMSCNSRFFKAVDFFRVLLHMQEVYQVVFCVLDRYLAICRPLHYTNMAKASTILAANIGSFILCGFVVVILFSVSLTGYQDKWYGCLPTFSKLASMDPLVVTVIVAIPAVIIVWSYASILKEMHKQSRRWSLTGSVRFPWMAIVLLLFLGICCIPAIIFVRLPGRQKAVGFKLTQTIRNLYPFGTIFIFTTSAPFRENCLKLFCPSVLRQRRRVAVQLAAVQTEQ